MLLWLQNTSDIRPFLQGKTPPVAIAVHEYRMSSQQSANRPILKEV